MKQELQKRPKNTIKTILTSIVTFTIRLTLLTIPKMAKTAVSTAPKIITVGYLWEPKFVPCPSHAVTTISARWIKVHNFSKIDALDTTWTATGALRRKRGEGCSAVSDNHWYWMGFISSRHNTTHCAIDSTLWEEGVSDAGSCDGLQGNTIWRQLKFHNISHFKNNQVYNFSLGAGKGQIYLFDGGLEGLDGSDLSWLVKGMRSFIEKKQYYVNHYGGVGRWEIFDKNEFTYAEFYARLTKSRHQGISLTNQPMKMLLRSNFGTLDSFTVVQELLVAKMDGFNAGGVSRNLIIKADLITEAGITVYASTMKFTFTPSSGAPNDHQLGVEIRFDYGTSTQTETLSLDIPRAETVDHLAILLGLSAAPDKGVTQNVFIRPEVSVQAGSVTETVRTTKLRTVTNFWINDILGVYSSTCSEAANPSNDCTSTHDFDIVLTSKSRFVGYLAREEVPSALWETKDPAHDARCWVPGISDPTLTTTPCFFCKQVNSRNVDGSFDVFVQDETTCGTSINTVAHPKLLNCSQGHYDSHACDECKDGFAINFNYEWIGEQTTACIANSECKTGLPQIAYEEISYGGGASRKFCTSCPHNCAACNTGMECSSCTSGFSVLNPSTKRCDCKVAHCLNCTSSECDICMDGRLKHLQADGSVTCGATNCDAGFGRLPGESLPQYYSAQCRPCQLANCPSCHSDYRVCAGCKDPNCQSCQSDYLICDVCKTGMEKDAETGLCVVPPPPPPPPPEPLVKCRSPKVKEDVNKNSSVCHDCSAKYKETEAAFPGLCGVSKTFNITEIEDFYEFYQAKRRFRIESAWFSSTTPLTASILSNSFTVTMTPSNISFRAETTAPDLIDIVFDEFSVREMQITFSLSNSTIEETFRSNDDSVATKLLISEDQQPVSFKITNINYDLLKTKEPNEELAESSGEAVGRTGSALASLSTVAVVLGSVIGADMSGSMLKAIQFILLFDKLRLINVELGSILGGFMEMVYEAFKSNLVEKDDFEQVAKIGHNQLFKQEVPVIAYRKKLDKMVMMSVCAILSVFSLILRLTVSSASSPKKVIFVGKTMYLVDRVQVGLTLMSMVDVLFYCGHQVLHQRPDAITVNKEYFSTFLWSFGLLIYSIGSVYTILSRLSLCDDSDLTKIAQMNKNPKNKKKGKNEAKDDKESNKRLPGTKVKLGKLKNEQSSQRDLMKTPLKKPKRSSLEEAMMRQIPEIRVSQAKQNILTGVPVRLGVRLNPNSSRSVKKSSLFGRGSPTRTRSRVTREGNSQHTFGDSPLQSAGQGSPNRLRLPIFAKNLEKYGSTKYPKNDLQVISEHGNKVQKGNSDPVMRAGDKRLTYTPKIDIKSTLKNFVIGAQYSGLVANQIDPGHIEAIPRYYNLTYSLRICLDCLPILTLQSAPLAQVSLIGLIEGGYLIFLIIFKCKYSSPVSNLNFFMLIIESFCVINFLLYSGLYHKNSTSRIRAGSQSFENSLRHYEYFVLGCFGVIMLI